MLYQQNVRMIYCVYELLFSQDKNFTNGRVIHVYIFTNRRLAIDISYICNVFVILDV